MDKDYTLLRAFDPEKARAGEAMSEKLETAALRAAELEGVKS